MKQKLDSLFWRFAEEKFVYGEFILIIRNWYLPLPTILKMPATTNCAVCCPAAALRCCAEPFAAEPTNGSAAMPKP